MHPFDRYQSVIADLSEKAYRRGIHYQLDHLHNFLADLGNPHLNLKNIIHIAGTNGKGSTLTFIASALIQNGFSVATFTSPHLQDYRERIACNFEPISETDFCSLYNEIKKNDGFYQLTEFEILTLMSILYFNRLQPDFIIYETGLGGRLDATNVFMPILSIITRIDYDHQAILGNTLTAIAAEKAGIIKPFIPVLTTTQAPDILQVLQSQAKDQKAPFKVIPALASIPPGFQMNGSYQTENLALAKSAIDHLKSIGISLDDAQTEKGFKFAKIAGRYDQYTLNNQTIIMDAGHNPSGISALVKTLQRDYPNPSFSVMVGIIRTKDVHTMMMHLLPIAKTIYYCDFEPETSYAFSEIQSAFPSAPLVPFSFQDPLPPGEPLIVTGSIYFLSKFIATFLK